MTDQDKIIAIKIIKMIDDETNNSCEFLYILKRNNGYPRELPIIYKLNDSDEVQK